MDERLTIFRGLPWAWASTQSGHGQFQPHLQVEAGGCTPCQWCPLRRTTRWSVIGGHCHAHIRACTRGLSPPARGSPELISEHSTKSASRFVMNKRKSPQINFNWKSFPKRFRQNKHPETNFNEERISEQVLWLLYRQQIRTKEASQKS